MNCRRKTLRKVVIKKNRYLKIVNNHKIQNYHKLYGKKHIVSKELEDIYKSLTPIYEELDNAFSSVDLVDLEFYERWLNG